MTQAEIDHAVALVTGETVRDVRHPGFSILPDRPASQDPTDLTLVIDCPFCRSTVPYPGRAGMHTTALAACLACDVEFEFDQWEVYAIDNVLGRTTGDSDRGLFDYR
jgi:hypothetical protein